MYQGFGCRVYDGEEMKGKPLLRKADYDTRARTTKKSTIWGQTCDGVDWVSKDVLMPELKEGEWLVYRNMGAYNTEVICNFNGFEGP